MVNYEKVFTYVVGIASIIALFISVWSLWVTYDATYGKADISLRYTLGGDLNQPVDLFFFRNNTILFQYLIKNTGHGSTAVSVEPIIECENCSFSLSYNGKEFSLVGGNGKRGIDIHSIAPQNTELIMIRFDNITREEAGDKVTVLTRDLETNKHLYINFRKLDEKFSDLMFDSIYGK